MKNVIGDHELILQSPLSDSVVCTFTLSVYDISHRIVKTYNDYIDVDSLGGNAFTPMHLHHEGSLELPTRQGEQITIVYHPHYNDSSSVRVIASIDGNQYYWIIRATTEPKGNDFYRVWRQSFIAPVGYAVATGITLYNPTPDTAHIGLSLSPDSRYLLSDLHVIALQPYDSAIGPDLEYLPLTGDSGSVDSVFSIVTLVGTDNPAQRADSGASLISGKSAIPFITKEFSRMGLPSGVRMDTVVTIHNPTDRPMWSNSSVPHSLGFTCLQDTLSLLTVLARDSLRVPMAMAGDIWHMHFTDTLVTSYIWEPGEVPRSISTPLSGHCTNKVIASDSSLFHVYAPILGTAYGSYEIRNLAPYPLHLVAYVLDNRGNVVLQNSSTLDLPPGQSITQTISYFAPDTVPLLTGVYFADGKGNFEDFDTVVLRCQGYSQNQEVKPSIDRESLAIFPQPAYRSVTISRTPTSSSSELEVYDALGHQVLKRRLSELTVEVDVSHFQPGLYFVRCGSSLERLIVAR